MATSIIPYVSHNLDNIDSIQRIVDQTTTGGSGNILTPYENDGYTVIIAAFAAGANVSITPFVSSTNNRWYLKVRDADTNATVNNTLIAYRYYVLRTK